MSVDGSRLAALVRDAWVDRVCWLLAVWQPGVRRLSSAEVEAALDEPVRGLLPDGARLGLPLAFVHPEAGAVVRMVRSFATAIARETASISPLLRLPLASFVGDGSASTGAEEGADEEGEEGDAPLNAARLSAFLRKAEECMVTARPWRDLPRGGEAWASACTDIAKLTSLAVIEATGEGFTGSIEGGAPTAIVQLVGGRREAGALLAAASLALVATHLRSCMDQLNCLVNALQFLAAGGDSLVSADDLLPALATAAAGLEGPLSAAIPQMRAFLAVAAPLDGLGAYALVSLEASLAAGPVSA